MKTEFIKTKIEIYICNHRGEDREDCASKDSKELTNELKLWAKEVHPKEIKVYRSGCLGKCSEGIAIACYPEKKLWTEVKREDSEAIKKGLEEALKK